MSTAYGAGDGQDAGRSPRKQDEVPINGTADKSAQSPAEIEADIEQQREQLAHTLDALGAKLDVKSQAQAKAQDVKGQARAKVLEAKGQAQVKAQRAKGQAHLKAQQAKVQTRLKTAEAKERATTDTGQPRPEVMGAAAALVVGAVALIWWRRSR